MEKKSSKSWRVCEFDVSDKRIQFYKDLDKKRMAIGKEICPHTKKPHMHVYICFYRPYRWNAFGKLLGSGKPHYEIALVDDWNYELKDMDYILEDNRQGQRNDLAKIRNVTKVRDIVDEVNYQGIRHAEIVLKYKEAKRMFKPEVYWIHGPTGTEKTKRIYDKEKLDDIFVPINFKWWEGYDAHEVVIIDDFRRDYCKFHELLKLLDRYPFRVETKGGSRQLLAKRMYITTPYSIDETYAGRTSEDLNQLKRRITKEIYSKDPIKNLVTVTEVEEGNTSFLDILP